MSRARVNENVTQRVETDFGERMKQTIKERCRTVTDFCCAYGMTPPAVYDRLADPDKFTLGQLREARLVLGLTKAEMVEMVRCML